MPAGTQATVSHSHGWVNKSKGITAGSLKSQTGAPLMASPHTHLNPVTNSMQNLNSNPCSRAKDISGPGELGLPPEQGLRET